MTITFNKKAAHCGESIKLDHNENPLGPSPLAIKAAQHALLNCHRYPDSQATLLKNNLATYLGVPPQTITLGNGAEDLLELVGKTYLTEKDSAIVPNYSFSGIARIIRNKGAELRVATNTPLRIQPTQILTAINSATKIVFIVNPNNPTGTYINHHDLSFLLENLPGHVLLVIDEAYVEYVDANNYPNTINLTEKYSNLIIIRTFSKFYGLAGLRLGYMISHADIIQQCGQQTLPYSVNSIAIAAAHAALRDQKHMHLSWLSNKEERAWLIQGLKNLALISLPSQTNFICVDLQKNSLPVYKQLLRHRIYVRPLHDYGLPNHLRISIGSKKQNHYLLGILRKILMTHQDFRTSIE